MTVIIDRRKNQSQKSVSNRQRFIKRSEKAIKRSINKNLKDKNIDDMLDGDTVTVPVKDISEPVLSHSGSRGQHDYIYPGNDQYEEGDAIEKSYQEEDGGNGAGQGGGGRDSFQFILSKEEYLDLLFDDMELPNLMKKDLQSVDEFTYKYAGHSISGSPTNLDIEQSIMMSLGRRMALKRPSDEELKELEDELKEFERKVAEEEAEGDTIEEIRSKLIQAIEELRNKQKRIPYLDDMDIRYNHYEQRPEPAAKAVMFCLMDVSGSMGEIEKTLAKKFFVLLYLFLVKKYGGRDKVKRIYIRHTEVAEEVSENTFFYGRETGGTVVSSALSKLIEIQKRFPTSEWNIYAAQVSDGDNWDFDNEKCYKLLKEQILEFSQYFAYIQVDRYGNYETLLGNSGEPTNGLWKTYSNIDNKNFAIKRVRRSGDIWPVFSELFERRKEVK